MNSILKNAREKVSLTQVQIADKVKISERHYQKIEAGDCLPNAHTAIMIAKAVNSSVEELFTPALDKPIK